MGNSTSHIGDADPTSQTPAKLDASGGQVDFLDPQVKAAEDARRPGAVGRRKSDEELLRSYEELHVTAQTRANELAKLNDALQAEIARREATQNELILEKQQLETIAANVDAGLFLLDAETRVTYANKLAQEWFGPIEEIGGRFCWEAFRMTDPDGACAGLKVLKTHEQASGDSFVVLTGGQEKYFYVIATPIMNERGEIHHISELVVDITERKRVEKELSHLAAIVESSSDAIIGNALDGTITSWNRGAEKLWGYSAAEAIGKPVSILSPRDRATEMPYLLEKVSRGEKINRFESMRHTKSGLVCDTSVTMSPIRDYSGQIIGSSTMAHDITHDKRARELSDALNDISVAVNSTFDVDEIMRAVLRRSAATFKTDGAGVALSSKRGWTIVHTHGSPLAQKEKGEFFSHEEAPSLGAALRSGKPIVIDDAARDLHGPHDLMISYGIRSMLILPLFARGEGIGALFFSNHDSEVRFSEAELDFATKLGSSVSLAVENARLYTVERNVAETLQEALVPLPENIDGLEHGHLYHSATDTSRVGGDFYDLFELEDGKVGVIIGDVCGKGLDAAALTGVVKSTIRAYAFLGDAPAEVIGRTNRALESSFIDRPFVTVFFGIWDRHTHLLSYCNAGHPPAVLRKAGRGVSLLKIGSPLIGVFHDFEYSDHIEPFSTGDQLFLYTDGVIEARQGETQFGEERLMEFIAGLPEGNVAALPHTLYERLVEFTGGRLNDDVAMMAISPTA